ncbi:MAG: hypothetical protein L6R35_005876 [Caloplaca aegaea]|nr:MAG: hypothetical protein L6R35_005876 [Caloplaca aegaea]
MSTDYSKKTVADLQEILKTRSLHHTGKKADLIARLQQADKDAASTAKPTTSDIPAEDEIDWDDDAGVAGVVTPNAASTDVPALSATTPAAAAAIAAGGQGQVANPTAVPNQIPTDEPFKTDDITVKAPGDVADEVSTAAETKAADETTKTTEQPAKPPTDYTANIPQTSLDDEIEKRKKRAARFGIVTDGAEKDSAKAMSIKALERAKKFGTADASKPAVKGLDEALPERKKRGRGADEDGGRGTKRSRGGRHAGNADRRSRSRSKSKSKSNRTGESQRPVTNGDAKSSTDAKAAQKEKDRLAAEARKKRFGAAT